MLSTIQELSTALRTFVPEEPVEIRGSWSTSGRTTLKGPLQIGGGSSPIVEVMDARWTGELECAVPVVGIGFLSTRADTYWIKSLPLPVERYRAEAMGCAYPEHVWPDLHVSLRARTGYDGFHREAREPYLADRASLEAGLRGACLPAVPFTCGEDLIASCSLGPAATTTSRAHVVAEVDGAAFTVILLPRSVVKVGRNRRWRMRDEIASLVPAGLRAPIASGRAGRLKPG